MVVPEILDTSSTFVRPNKAENTDPRTNYAVKYASARGHHEHQGKSNTHRIVVTVLCRLLPLLPEGECALFR